MCHQLLSTLVFCLSFTTILSLQCYAGTDTQCMLAPDMNYCGPDETCQCVKYRFQCTLNDLSCNEDEQLTKVKKWAYTILPTSTCQYLKALPSIYENLTCCATKGCNLPGSGKCSWSQDRRRAIRKFNDLLNF